MVWAPSSLVTASGSHPPGQGGVDSSQAPQQGCHEAKGNDMCKRCKRQSAESAQVSVFLLCGSCADELYPGSDVARYMELRRLYGRTS